MSIVNDKRKRDGIESVRERSGGELARRFKKELYFMTKSHKIFIFGFNMSFLIRYCGNY